MLHRHRCGFRAALGHRPIRFRFRLECGARAPGCAMRLTAPGRGVGIWGHFAPGFRNVSISRAASEPPGARAGCSRKGSIRPPQNERAAVAQGKTVKRSGECAVIRPVMRAAQADDRPCAPARGHGKGCPGPCLRHPRSLPPGLRAGAGQPGARRAVIECDDTVCPLSRSRYTSPPSICASTTRPKVSAGSDAITSPPRWLSTVNR
ncbi:hypothetical protein SAMN05421849_1318 [Pontibaca methylaminivorans]|uniref:Uncharacterized protein n=1 Tax=Pontibaca methylaminivorans TaxID=515897 RepID=A0A1R3WRC2_9RHOB|nr:hypothetical protein SAMN05421849_1318 [Pontibaca methylaminivorans]